MLVVLAVLKMVLVIGLAVVLVRRFRSTGNSGYLVLAVPLVLWGFISSLPQRLLFESQIDRLQAGESLMWPLSWFNAPTVGEMVAVSSYFVGILQTALVILGFLWLGHHERQARDRSGLGGTGGMRSESSSLHSNAEHVS